MPLKNQKRYNNKHPVDRASYISKYKVEIVKSSQVILIGIHSMNVNCWLFSISSTRIDYNNS